MIPDGRTDVTQLIAEARLSALSMEQHAATVHAERLLMVSAHQMRSTAAQLRKLATALTELQAENEGRVMSHSASYRAVQACWQMLGGRPEGKFAADLPDAITERIREATADWRRFAARLHPEELMQENLSLRSQLSEREARVAELESDDWRPTAANVNALPLRIRQYVHDLATKCDPSGDIRTIGELRDTVAALQEALSTTETEARKRERVAIIHFDAECVTERIEKMWQWLDANYPLTPAKAEGEKTNGDG